MLCHNLVLTTLPQRIFNGGGVAAAHPQLLQLVRQSLRDSMAGYWTCDDVDALIASPGLGKGAGLLGSLALASTIAKWSVNPGSGSEFDYLPPRPAGNARRALDPPLSERPHRLVAAHSIAVAQH